VFGHRSGHSAVPGSRVIGVDALVVIKDGCAAAVELVRPEHALAGLETVFGFNRRDMVGIHELCEQ
jgi:hypothetical protein